VTSKSWESSATFEGEIVPGQQSSAEPHPARNFRPVYISAAFTPCLVIPTWPHWFARSLTHGHDDPGKLVVATSKQGIGWRQSPNIGPRICRLVDRRESALRDYDGSALGPERRKKATNNFAARKEVADIPSARSTAKGLGRKVKMLVVRHGGTLFQLYC
jgi:hypothetical protein